MTLPAQLSPPDPEGDAPSAPRGRRAVTAALLAAIVLLALFLRVHRLAELPAGFYCDEAGLGYNAASILRTGYDENGSFLPLYVWSFGLSYKNPVFIYSSMLPIALFGANELAVRLTSALYGTATVLATYFLASAMLGPFAGLAGALLLALCPWHLHFSRIAFELVTMPLFVVLGATDLVRFGRGRRTLWRAMLFFAIALYAYVPAQMFVPLLLAGLAFVYRSPLSVRWKESLAAAAVFAVTALPLAVFDLTHREQAGSYFRRTTILSAEAAPSDLARQLAANYATFFHPSFLLFEGGDRVLRHQVRGHGLLYSCFAPLLIAGLVTVLARRDRAMALPLLWVVLYPLPAALMNEIPSASRSFIGSVGFCLLAALGADGLRRGLALLAGERRMALAVQGLVFAIAAAVLAGQARHYWRLYSAEYPRYSAKFYSGFQFGNRQVADYFRRHYDEYDELILSQRKSNMANVFLRFWDGLARPPREGIMPPFEHGEKMRVGWPDDLDQYDGRRLLFAVLPEEMAVFERPIVRERIVAPDGSDAYVLVEARGVKDFVTRWRVAGPYGREEEIDPPEVDPGAARPAPGGRRWRLYRRPKASVALNDYFGVDVDESCAWAVNLAHSDVEQTVRIWAGFDEDGEVWVNGEPVRLDFRAEGDDWLADSEVGDVVLRAGWNPVAVRSCDERGDWRFYFRLASPDGGKVEGVNWKFN